jgi:CheY-like chemotaxis protein
MSTENGNPIYKRVMIIDDTYVDRYVAERNILKYGISAEVISKESAKAGLLYLQSCELNQDLLPQLIFLDIRMPEMDGFGFLAEYEKLPESVKANCVVMMLSTSLNPEDHEKVKENKYVSRFLNKPLDKDKIDQLLGNGK